MDEELKNKILSLSKKDKLKVIEILMANLKLSTCGFIKSFFGGSKSFYSKQNDYPTEGD